MRSVVRRKRTEQDDRSLKRTERIARQVFVGDVLVGQCLCGHCVYLCLAEGPKELFACASRSQVSAERV